MKPHALINTILGPASAVGLPPSHAGAGARESAMNPVVRVAGSLQVAGDVAADVVAEGDIVISSEARIRGNVTASSAIIGGIVKGNVVSPEGVTLLSSAVVLGDVATHHLRIDDGAVLTGRVTSDI